MKRGARLTTLFVLAVALAHASPAFADARSKARKSFEEGMRLIEAKKFLPGIEALRRANEIVPHPDVQYNLARACLDAGLLTEALQWFETYLEQPTPPPDDAEVREVVRSLRARLFPAASPEERTRAEEASEVVAKVVKPAPLPEDTARDLKRLEQLAADLKPLAEDRARELETIAGRLREVAEAVEGARPTLAQGGAKTRDADTKASARGAKLEPASTTIARATEVKDEAKVESKATPATPIDLGKEGLREIEEYQEQEIVTAATRRAASAQDAPAVVWVITQHEIRSRGYESVAEALRDVAGLHVIDDHVFVDVGIRGVHAGLRGQSRVMKVLVDDHPIAFRPTSGNLLGLEMIPIRAVDRIELIRGPASALYGANAFLGVLQIITRKGGDIRGASIAARGSLSTATHDAAGALAPHGSGSADLIFGTKEGRVSVLLAMQAASLDRSGLSLPGSSPFEKELNEAGRGPSQNDEASPLSLFGSLRYELGKKGTLSLQSGLQRLESRAEWLDYGALTHYSTIALYNAWARLDYDVALSDQAGLRAFTSFASAGPTNANRIRPFNGYALAANDARHIEESYGSRAFFSGLEARWEPKKLPLSARAGIDLDVDRETLGASTIVFDAAEGQHASGDSIPAARPQLPERTFTDFGAYLQLSTTPASFVDLVGGLRYDWHNLFGSAVNGRLGSVFRLSNALYVKALYGSSLRAPAPDQLQRGAAYVGDAIGCLDYRPCADVSLRPETAHTAELVVGMNAGEVATAQLTGYLSFVNDLILSFPNALNNFVTTNAGSYLSKGLELELALKPATFSNGVRVQVHAFLSMESTSSDIAQALFKPAEALRAEYRQVSLFPGVGGGGGIDVASTPAHLGLYLEGRFVGPRRASPSNLTLSLGDDNYADDSLPAYFVLDANLSTRDLYLFGAGETVISIRATDLLGTAGAEGGHRGWDIPALGRVVSLRLIQEL